MFVSISQLITKASLSGLHLMIRPAGEGRVSVFVSVEKSGVAPTDTKLLNALSQNICVEGSVTELDETFINSILQFGENFNAPTVTTNISEATCSVKKPKGEGKQEAGDETESQQIIKTDEAQSF